MNAYTNRFGSWRMALATITSPVPTTEWSVDSVDPEDGNWLAGIADSESTFRLAKHATSFSPIWGLQLRADDLCCLQEMQRIIGVYTPLTFWHRDNDRKRGINAGDAARFYIRDIPTHYSHTIPFFTRFHLRCKKAAEFPLFAEAVNILHDHQLNLLTRRYTEQMRQRLEEIKAELEALKKYHPITD